MTTVVIAAVWGLVKILLVAVVGILLVSYLICRCPCCGSPRTLRQQWRCFDYRYPGPYTVTLVCKHCDEEPHLESATEEGDDQSDDQQYPGAGRNKGIGIY